MLVQLSIRDIVLIDRLDIEFDGQLSVLTGETGAGKSILLDALSLALGARGDASRVREGCDQGQVTAVFDVSVDHPVRQLLRDNDIDADGDILLKRIQKADGRARVFLNDQPASVALMREAGAMLVELHGQHDDRALIDPATHRTILDAFGENDSALQKVALVFRQWRACLRDAEEEREAITSARRDRDFLEASLTELRTVGPKVGEEEQLATRRADMMAIEKTASDIRDAAEVISGPQATLPVLAALQRRLARKAADAPSLLNPLMEALEQALDGLDLLQAAVDEALRKVNFDGAELEATEERLFLLRGLARKHSCTVDQLPAVMARMEHALETLEAGEERLVALEARAAALRAEFAAAADSLSKRRREAATRLCETVHAELPGLKLGNAEFIVQIDTEADQPSSTGIDTVEFWVRTNPGTRAGPMMKVASGGELSRFLLALKVALAERASAPTLIFDEIDTGVGGAVADAIGQRLARLAEHVQVLSVTHAPQVAARAAHHFLIEKSTGGDGQTRTSLVPLDASRRQEEVARMLAGATITDEARKAAARLLDGADAA